MKLEDLWLKRTKPNKNGDRVPTFWQPKELPVIEGDSGDYGLMSRLVALGLVLEIPVSQFVSRQMNLIPGLNQGLIKKVLDAQKADEGRHDRGMKFAADFLKDKGYTVDTSVAQAFLADAEALPYSPLTLAALLEVTCFLPFLALMRLRGGQAFNRLALRINEDEQLHVKVNASLAKQLGEPIPTLNKWVPIRDSILDYVVGDRPEDKDLMYSSSEELRLTGNSPTLNRMPEINATGYVAPMEVQSSEKYSRTTSLIY